MLTRLVYNFLRQRPGALDALIEELRRRPNYFRKVGPRDYAAAFGGIRVCDDIYGHEVKLGWKPFAELLDCRPAYYGVSQEDAERLYRAILACVPGTIYSSKGAACA